MARGEWLTKKGQEERRLGVKEKESKYRKISYCVFFAASIFVYMIPLGLHGERAGNANRINQEFRLLHFLALPYDTCKFPYFKKDPSVGSEEWNILKSNNEAWCIDKIEQCQLGTRWTSIFNYNIVVLTMTCINFLVLTCGAFYWTPRMIGTVINCCCGCCNFFAFTGAIGYRFNPAGAICAVNIAPSTYGNGKWSDSTTY